MNQRIKELAEQAYDTVEFNYAPSKEIFNKQKFAELIVAECTRIVINNGVATATHDQMVRQDCVNEIKQHFGVEE